MTAAETAKRVLERSEDVLANLEMGRTDPFAASGYGYEHMGDMARDLEPLAEDSAALARAFLAEQEKGK